MSEPIRVVVLVQRIGPYHHARFETWARIRTGALGVVEFRPEDRVYAWNTVTTAATYRRWSVRSRGELRARLAEFAPQAIVCVGYADREIHAAMAWAQARRIPLVTCSDSTQEDQPRWWLKERMKRLIVSKFDAALVAGQRSRDYLQSLGVPADRIFQPWDVVDNDYFACRADAARKGPESENAVRCDRPYFLTVARFVPKKNLEILIRAHASHVKEFGNRAWLLVLSGSGELEPRLRQAVSELGTSTHVRFPGFLQYDQLPAWYAGAGALVLPSISDQWGLVVNEAMASGLPVLVSSRCGCAPDLVREGSNGFRFDPRDAAALAVRLGEMAQMDEARRIVMGMLSREIVERYSPSVFAQGIEMATRCACESRTVRKSHLAWGLVDRLAAGGEKQA